MKRSKRKVIVLNRQQRLLWLVMDKSGMTQVSLAEKLKCTPQFLNNIKRGVANLPMEMWRQLLEEKQVSAPHVVNALLNDYRDKLHAELFE